MPFIVLNKTNAFDPVHQTEHGTAEQADAAARDLLRTHPNSVLLVAQVLKRYTAEVTVSVQDVDPVQEGVE